ncbi:MAG: hypothetical protein ACWGQW_22155, partial [bacterium]
MQFLKADTQVKVAIGPVVAVGDGFTPVTTLDVNTADEAYILKHDNSTAIPLGGSTHTFDPIISPSMDGYYHLTLTTSDTDTEGNLTVGINDDSLCLPVIARFTVVSANVYDSLFAAATTDYLQIDMIQIGGVAQSATDLKDFADDGYDPATNKVQGVVLTDTCTTLSGHTPQSGDTFAELPANLSVLGIDSDGNITEVALLTGHTPQSGDVYAQLPTNLSSMLIDSAGSVNADVVKLDGAAVPAARMAEYWSTVETGTTNSGATTTTFDADGFGNLVLADVDGRIVQFLSGPNANLVREIIGYTDNSTYGSFTLNEALPSAPGPGVNFNLLPGVPGNVATDLQAIAGDAAATAE